LQICAVRMEDLPVTFLGSIEGLPKRGLMLMEAMKSVDGRQRSWQNATSEVRARRGRLSGIPLGDVTRRPLHRPVVTILIIVVNFLVFFLELRGGDPFVQQWSVIPTDIVAGHHWITILTAMFMHEGWLHILGNMVFFWSFGPQIEDAMGPFRYLTFYLLCGLVASLGQIAALPTSSIPNLGASGAIAGVMEHSW